MTYLRILTDRSKDWNAQPQCFDAIKDFHVSKTSNECSEPSLDDEHWLYEFDEVYSIDQAFHGHLILRKRKIVKV